MIDATLVERYVRNANPIPHVDDLDVDELAHAVAVTYARREAAMQTPNHTPMRPPAPVAPSKPRRAWAFVLGVIMVLAGIGITAFVLQDNGGRDDEQTAGHVQVDSLVWSRVRSTEPTLFSGVYGITAGGPGFVAVAADWPRFSSSAVVLTSPDGISWSKVASLDDGAFGLRDVTAGGPGLVAVGGAGCGYPPCRATVWTSPDGLTWSQIAHDESIFGGGGMASVTVGGPGLVAVGTAQVTHDTPEHAAVWTSPDGSSWSRVPHDQSVFGPGTRMLDVAAGGPGLVGVGSDDDGFDAAVWISPDGLTWSRVPSDEQVFGAEPTGAEVQRMTSVIAGGPGLVAIGGEQVSENATNHAAVWTSSDGLSWSRVPHDWEVFGPLMESVTSLDSGLVAVGWDETGPRRDHAVVWTSPDGLTWSRLPHNELAFRAAGMSHVISGGPGLVALGTVDVQPSTLLEYSYPIAMVWVAGPES